MKGFLLDSSWIVACLCGWHEHHGKALGALRKRLDQSQQLYLAAPALVETYAVLTRLPAPHRLSPIDAGKLLKENFHRRGRTVSLNSKEYWQVLDEVQAAGIAGGRTYDYVIGFCAKKSGAQALLTLNPADFDKIVAPEIKVISG